MSENKVRVEGDVIFSIAAEGKKLINGGKCCELTWKYLEDELRAANLIQKHEEVNQIDIHTNGIRIALTDNPKEIN